MNNAGSWIEVAQVTTKLAHYRHPVAAGADAQVGNGGHPSFNELLIERLTRPQFRSEEVVQLSQTIIELGLPRSDVFVSLQKRLEPKR